MKGEENKLGRKKDMVCEPASSPRNFWEDKNGVTRFVLQKDFSKSPSKMSGLLTAKFPFRLTRVAGPGLTPASANSRGVDCRCRVLPVPIGTSFIAPEALECMVAVSLLMVASVARGWSVVLLCAHLSLLCG